MDVRIIKAWRGRYLDNPVVIFGIGSKRFSYIGTANDHPLIRQTVGGDKVREHRRELSRARYDEVRSRIEAMLANGEVPFGPPPAI